MNNFRERRRDWAVRRCLISAGSVLLLNTAIAQTLLIENVTLIDGTGAAPLGNATVVVDGERISAVSPVSMSAPTGATRIDGTGKFLIPGLMDTHIHLAGGRQGMVTEGQRTLTMDFDTGVETVHGYLYSGVTSLYDAGNHTKFIFRMRDDERAGRIVSPRIFAAGAVVSFPSGYASGVGSVTVGSWDDIGNLDELLGMQPDMVKFILDPQGWGFNTLKPAFSLELLKRLIQYCQERGVRTTIHVSSEEHALQAVDAGINTLAHVMIRGRINDSFAQLMAARRIPMSTTMTVYSNISRIAAEPDMFDSRLFIATLSAQERDRQKTRERQRYIDSGMSRMFSALVPLMQENIGKLYRSGAILAAGTDRTFGPTLHQELESLVKAGVTPSDAIRMATLNGAIYLGKEDDLGSIARGKLADMVLLSADPTLDIKNAQAIEAVFKGGTRIDLNQLRLPVNQR
jgi:imidazolonepropionase-like amidohydrolase